MIDRGALIVEQAASGAYRGVHRRTLDAMESRDPRFAAVRDAYRAAVVEGDGVLEDLDDAISLRARAIGAGSPRVEVIVFECPREPAPREGALALAVAIEPPAEGLRLLGYDVCELIEPFWSVLSRRRDATPTSTGTDTGTGTETGSAPTVNADGLIAARTDAERLARERNTTDDDEDLHVVRVWLAG